MRTISLETSPNRARGSLTIAAALAALTQIQTPFVLAAESPAGGPDAANAASLPLSEVILYSSGVGYFERSGEIEGRKEVDLRFKVDDINDLLKSMVLQDFNGGRISTVTYSSRDPVTKTLQSFGLDLTQNPTLGQLLNQARGERVELLWPNRVTGTILGVEQKRQPLADDKQIEVEYLNLVTDDGLQSIPLAQVQKVKLLNERLNAELRQALEVLATSHDTEKKTVGLVFDGEGKRKVSVAYVIQTPVWKTSYRLVLDVTAKPFLQGWAIVENRSDEDWENVRLALVSGRPISFIMDLYEPLYSTRPVVQPELYSSLRPQVYGDAIELTTGQPLAQAPRVGGFGGGGGFDGATATIADNLAYAVPPQEAKQLRESLGVQGGTAPTAASPEQRRLISLGRGVTPTAQGAVAGELFEYHIKAPVSLARQKSAMLPILNEAVDGEKVSIYNQNVQPKYALNGFRLKNTGSLHLMQGPLTVFDASAYAGDAQIDDLAPGQERLLSYGLDLKTEVEPQSGKGRNELVTVKIQKGTLIATRKAEEEKTYNVRNRDRKKKTILIEHPFRTDWHVVEPKEKPERTREVYRFTVPTDPDKTTKLTVREEKQFDERVQLANIAKDGIHLYLRSSKVSDKVKKALGDLVALRDRLNQTEADRGRREQRTSEITQEQTRIRENMTRLNQSSDLYGRYVKKLDEQETELEGLRKEIETFKDTEAKQQRELNDFLLSLTIE